MADGIIPMAKSPDRSGSLVRHREAASGRRGDPELALQFRPLDCFGASPLAMTEAVKTYGRWYNRAQTAAILHGECRIAARMDA